MTDQRCKIQREYWLGSDGSHHWQNDDGSWSSEGWTLGTTITLKYTPLLAGGVDVYYNGVMNIPTRTSWSGAKGTLDFTPDKEDVILCNYPR
jgi:hypothetical protein